MVGANDFSIIDCCEHCLFIMHINNCKLNTNGLKLFKLNAHGMIILLGEGSLSFFLFLFLIRINSCGARDYGGFFVLCQKY